MSNIQTYNVLAIWKDNFYWKCKVVGTYSLFTDYFGSSSSMLPSTNSPSKLPKAARRKIWKRNHKSISNCNKNPRQQLWRTGKVSQQQYFKRETGKWPEFVSTEYSL